MTKFSLLFIVFCFFTKLFSQSYSFINYSIPEGLAQTQVKAIIEDKDGYLWIGTLGGLSRFNGDKFINFSSTEGLVNNRITSLNIIDNHLWVGHQGGISKQTEKGFEAYPFSNDLSNLSVSQVVKFENKILILTNGNGIYQLKNKRLFQIDGYIGDQLRIRDGIVIQNELFLATRAGLLKITKNINNPITLSTSNLTNFSFHNNYLYFGDIDGNVQKYDLKKNRFYSVLNPTESTYAFHVFVDSKSRCWSSYNNGIILKEPYKTAIKIDSRLGLDNSQINVVYEDKNGTIWIGSDGQGLLRFSGTHLVYFNQLNSSLSSDLVTSSYRLKNNTLLFGTYDKGLFEYQKTIFFQSFNPQLVIWDIIEDEQKNCWLATQEGLFKKVGRKIDQYTFKDGAPGLSANCFYKHENQIYVGGSDGLSIIQDGKVKPIYVKQHIGTIRNIIAHKNFLYLASDDGIYLLKNNKLELITPLNKRVFSIVKDKFDKIWIGTEEGLYTLHKNKLIPFFLSEQPASNYVNFLNHHDGYVFVGTNNGLYTIKVNASSVEKSEKLYIGKDEGIINVETNINSSFIDQNKYLWFGTAKGLVRIDLSFLKDNNQIKSNILLAELSVNYQSEEILTSKYWQNSQLKLPHNKNNISFKIDIIRLKNQKELKLKYRIKELSNQWITSNELINLTNMPSGAFTVDIQAFTANGKVGNLISIPIEISPIFYKTWWFITLLILLVTLSVFGIFRFRLNIEKAKRYRESLEYKTRLLRLEQQSLNASMNRHFIFNSLNSIQYFINTQDKLSANKFLSNFARLIRMNLDASEENNLVSLKEELDRLNLYLNLESMRFKDKFIFEIIDNNIDTESIEVPAMLLQPFVENSIIHGVLPLENRQGKITIVLTQNNNEIIIKIRDNGVGIQKSLSQKTNFQGDHKSQGMEITSKRINLINKISSDEITLEGPYQLENDRLINGTEVLIKIVLKNLENQD